MKPNHITKELCSEEAGRNEEIIAGYSRHFIQRAKERFDLSLTESDVTRLNRVVKNRLGQKFDPWVVPLGQVSRQIGSGSWARRIGLLLWIDHSYYVCVYDAQLYCLVTILPSKSIRLAKDKKEKKDD